MNMKANKPGNPKEQPKPAVTVPQEPTWKPTWKWHLKVLAGIYIGLGVVYFAISAFLNRVPPPYHMREIPKELTPWMK